MKRTRTHISKVKDLLHKASASLTDEDALEAAELFPNWSGDGVQYELGVRLRYGEKLYKVLQSHTSQSDWTPDITPALYTKVAEPGDIPVWVQPTGVQDAYREGDKVHYPTKDDPVYISIVPDNVWPPDVYGWKLYEGEEG